MSFFPNIDYDAIREGAQTASRAGISFGVQALRLLSEIRDNTAPGPRRDLQILSRAVDPLPGSAGGGNEWFEVLRFPSDGVIKSWRASTLTAGTWSSKRIAIDFLPLFNIGSNVQTQNTGEIPFKAGQTLQYSQLVFNAGADTIGCTITLVVEYDEKPNPGRFPWNPDYSSVDSIGVTSTIHLPIHKENASE